MTSYPASNLGGKGSELNLLRANNQASKLKGPLNTARPSHPAPSHWVTDGESKAGEAEPLPKSLWHSQAGGPGLCSSQIRSLLRFPQGCRAEPGVGTPVRKMWAQLCLPTSPVAAGLRTG